MFERVISLLFCVVLGIASLGLAGWLVVTGKVVASVDGLFIVLVALLTALVCFGYLGMQFRFSLSSNSKSKKR